MHFWAAGSRSSGRLLPRSPRAMVTTSHSASQSARASSPGWFSTLANSSASARPFSAIVCRTTRRSSALRTKGCITAFTPSAAACGRSARSASHRAGRRRSTPSSVRLLWPVRVPPRVTRHTPPSTTVSATAPSSSSTVMPGRRASSTSPSTGMSAPSVTAAPSASGRGAGISPIRTSGPRRSIISWAHRPVSRSASCRAAIQSVRAASGVWDRLSRKPVTPRRSRAASAAVSQQDGPRVA